MADDDTRAEDAATLNSIFRDLTDDERSEIARAIRTLNPGPRHIAAKAIYVMCAVPALQQQAHDFVCRAANAGVRV
jgi:hypothetical protein